MVKKFFFCEKTREVLRDVWSLGVSVFDSFYSDIRYISKLANNKHVEFKVIALQARLLPIGWLEL